MPYYVIDRFEGDYAICEDEQGQRIQLLRSILPDEAVEGSVLHADGCDYICDPALEKVLRQRNADLQKRVFGDE